MKFSARKRRLSMGGGTLLALLGPIAAAHAQTADDNEAVQAGDIIVTAQKRSERLQDVPLSITAASGSQLQTQGVNDVADLQRIVPGFTAQRSTYGQPIFTLRGIGFFDNSLASAPTISVYVDQVPLPFSVMTSGVTLDLERVEVLKGPQGTLFGQNSTGGAINYIAAKPTDTLSGGLDVGYGRFNALDIEGFVSGPLASNLRARLAVRTERADGWQRSVSRNDSLGRRNFLTGRFLLDWEASDTLSFQFNANGFRDKSDTQANQLLGYFPTNPGDNFWDVNSFHIPYAAAYAPVRGNRNADWDLREQGAPGFGHFYEALRRNDKFYQLSLRGDLALSDTVDLTSITAWSDLKTEAPMDLDGTPQANLYSNQTGFARSFSQELRLSGTLASDRLQFMLGGNYQKDNALDHQFNRAEYSGAGFDPDGAGGPIAPTLQNLVQFINHQWVDTWAGFGSLDFKVADNLTLQASARYTDQKRKWQGCSGDGGNGGLAAVFSLLSTALSGSPTTVLPGMCGTLDGDGSVLGPAGIFKPVPLDLARQTLREDNLSWRLGLSWKPGDEVMLYANVTKGYKAGGFSTTPSLLFRQQRPIPQESVLAYEAGLKASLLDRSVDVAGAVFYYDYKDKQLIGYLDVGPPFGTLPGLVSIPESRVIGAELDVTVRPTDGLTLQFGGTHVDSKVRGSFFVVDPFAQESGIPQSEIGGQPFPNTPEWQLFADADVRFPLSSDWSAFLGGHVNYQSGTYATFGATDLFRQFFRVKGYSIVDVRAGVESEDGKWRVQLWGKNLFGTDYWNTVSRVTDMVVRQAGRPTTYGVTVTTEF